MSNDLRFSDFLGWLVTRVARPRIFWRKKELFSAIFCCNQLILANSKGKIGILKVKQLERIFARWEKLSEAKRWNVNQYNSPKWPQSPSKVYAPLVAPLISAFHQDSIKND
jgi:hypothetical protein